ncbi:hypothetical protein D918_06876 [Trichuris suis]|nr:hypothetical protein D918_06876 [Trichuris suis]
MATDYVNADCLLSLTCALLKKELACWLAYCFLCLHDYSHSLVMSAVFGIMECLRMLLAVLLVTGDSTCSSGQTVNSSVAPWNLTERIEKERSLCLLSHISFHTHSDTTSFTDLLAHFHSLIEKCAQNSTALMRHSGESALQRISQAASGKKTRTVRQSMDKSSPFASFLANSKLVVRSEDSNMTIAHVVQIESGESSISFSLWETHISIRAEKVNLSVSPVQQIIVFVLTKPRLFIQRDGCSHNFSSPFSNLSMQPTLEENGNPSGIKMVVTSYRWNFSGQCDTNYFNVTNSSTTVIILNLMPAVAHSLPTFLSLARHPGTESAFLVSSTAGLSLEAELRDSIIKMEQNTLQLVHTQVPSKLNIQTEKYRLLGSGDDFVVNMSKSELLLHYRNSQIRMSSSAFLTASFVNARMIISALNSSRTYAAHLWSESLPSAELDVLFSFLNLTIEPAFTQIIISTFNSSTVINRQSPSIRIMSNYSTMKLNSTVHVIHIFTGDWLQIMSSPKFTCQSDGVCVDAIPAAQTNIEIPFNTTQPPTFERMEVLQVGDQDPVTLKVATDETVDNANLLTNDVSAGESFVEANVPALAPLEDNVTVEGMYYLHQAGSLDSELFPVEATESSTSVYLTDADHIAIESEIIKIQVRIKYKFRK